MTEQKNIKKILVNQAVEFLTKDLKQSEIKIVNNEIVIDNKFIIDCHVFDIDGIYYIRNQVVYFLFNKENNFPIYQSKDFYRVYRELRKEMKRL